MTPIFADTSYYIALLSPRDAWHAQAVAFSRSISGPVLVTDFVVLEIANMYSATPRRDEVAAFIMALRIDSSVTIIPATRDLLDRGLSLYRSRRDKEWSLTDCTSFVVMQDHAVTEALTSDHHFEQAGFMILLK
ncbi:MAG TPA: PIN domain-containing protein [Pirellulaceae bacterium]|nr:PIN domain-containing protein [Pirellulaceae bacterium]